MNTPRSSHRSAGFSLVEIAVALLVIAVGVLAAFGLFPTGLQAGRASLDETRAILFAEETFNSFRGLAASPDVAWAQLTTTVPASGGTDANSLWHDPGNDLPPRITSNVRPNRYTASLDSSRFVPGAVPDLDEELEEYALRYILEAELLTDMLLGLRLWVWPGEFGAPAPGSSSPTADELENAFYFYTEIYRFEGPETDPALNP